MRRLLHGSAIAGSLLVLAGLLVAPPAVAEIADAPAGFDVVTRDVQPHTARVTIALVAPPGTQPNFSRDDAVASANAAAEFLSRETDGALTVEIEQVTDWMAAPNDAPCSWESVWRNFAAQQLGWERGNGRHLTVMVPYGDPCPGWANGEQGWSVDAGGRTFQPGPDASTLAHEWGHNMSQAHAFSTACTDTWDFRAVDGRTPADCDRQEYGNRLDNMGGSWTLTPFSSPSLDRLGLLPTRFVPRCDTTATATVASVAAGARDRGAISWESSVEPGVRYWVDYRDGGASAKYAPLHVSGWAFTPGSSGLQILRTDPEVPFGATVLERPGDASDWAQLVRADEAVTLADGTRVSWSPVASGTDRADVTVERTCAPVTTPALEADAVASMRKIGGSTHVIVAVTNRSTVAVDVEIATLYGKKTFTSVAPGKKVTATMNTRQSIPPAGEATVTLSTRAGDTTSTRSITAPYASR